MAGYAATKAGTEAEQDVTALSIDTIRGLAMDAVQKANAGHPGTAMALAPLGYTIFRRFLRANPRNPHWADRDRFVLSNGHACVLQYALLHLTGYDLTIEDLQQFRQWGSRTPGHPERGHTAGIEVTTGPLGQGISNAVGLAMAERFLAERYNRPGAEIVDHHTYVMCGDGDLMEGVSQEAASIAGNFGLGKLIACYDDNRITIDGTTALSFDAEDHLARFAANGWHVQRVADVEDLDALDAAIEAAKAETERPSFIAIRSHIGYPAPHAVDTAKAHGAPLGEAEVRAAKEVMGFDPERHFWVDPAVTEHMSLVEDGAAHEQAWQARFDAWAQAYPDLAEDWERTWRGELLEGWRDALPTFAAGESIATRSAGQKVMQAFAPFSPTMVGGAADLVESTKTLFVGGGEFSHVHAGRNIPFGIREHGMGAIVNGLSAHGGIIKPYGSTFLIFSDYMRGSVRLSALMGLPVLWVWTHDSVAVGEDGPTHEPIEHFAALRVIPDLWVVRPADANETSAAWRVALERARRPGRPAALPPEPGGARPQRGRLRRWSGARRVRPLGCARRRDPAHPDRHGQRGRDHPDGRPCTGAGGHRRPGRLDAVRRALRGRDRRVPRQRAPAVGAGPAGRRGRLAAQLVEVGRRRRGRARHRSLRRVGARTACARRVRLHTREHRGAREGRAVRRELNLVAPRHDVS